MQHGKRNFSLMIISDFTSTFGSTVFSLAMMWLVYEYTGSALGTSLIGVMSHLATIIFSPFAGIYVDNHEPKKVLIGSLLFSSAILFVLLIASFLFSDSIISYLMYVFVFLLFVSYSFTNPAETKLIPKIIDLEKVGKLYGYRSASSQLSALIASSMGGLIIAFGGITASSIVNIAAFTISAIAITFIHKIKSGQDEMAVSNEQSHGSFKERIREGYGVIKGNHKLFKIAQLTVLVNISSMLGPLWVVIVSDVFQSGAAEYGILQFFGLIGGVIAGLIVGNLHKKVKAGLAISIAMIGNGILIILTALSGNIFVAYLLFFFIVFSQTIFGALMSTILTLTIPDKVRGRVSGLIQSVAVVLIPAAAIIGGVISDLFGVEVVFLIAGGWTFLLGIYALKIRKIEAIANNNLSSD